MGESRSVAPIGHVMPQSSRLGTIDVLARSLDATASAGHVLVAVDGVGASGKSTFAAELAAAVHPAAIVHADDFFTPPEVRHARGRHSAEGFWLDAYDYPRIISEVLEPLKAGAPGASRPSGGLVVVEGTFLHRRELRAYWDFSIFLDVPIAEASRRMRARAGAELNDRLLARYFGAQLIYFRAAQPWRLATVVLDNREPDLLRVIDPGDSAAAVDARRTELGGGEQQTRRRVSNDGAPTTF